MQSVRFTTRVNPAADIQGRLDNLRRVAAPGSGASDNERQLALRLISKIEAQLKASGGAPRPAPSAPSASSTWRATSPPDAANTTFVPIPPSYIDLVAADLPPYSQKGKNFSMGVGGTYEFVKARTLTGVGVDGYLLLGKPVQHRRHELKPMLRGFYATVDLWPESAGQYPQSLELKADGLYNKVGSRIYAIDPADVKKLEQMEAFYDVVSKYT